MMFFRRLLYLFFFSAAFFYYIFHTGYLSWALFAIVIALPFLSLILTLPLRQGCRVSMQCDALSDSGLMAFLSLEPTMPYTPVRVQVLFENLFTGEVVAEKVIMDRKCCPRNKIKLHYESGMCGVVRLRVTRAHVMDLLGLFYLPVRAHEPIETLLLPEELPFNGDNIDWPAVEDTPSKHHAGVIGEREYKDLRPYRAGDSLRDVHWKLTARTGRPIVREYEFSAASVKTVAIDWTGTCGALCLALARLLGVARYFAAHGEYILLFSDEETHEYASPDADVWRTLLWNALSKPPREQRGTTLPPDNALLVGPKDILLYENGVLREVVSS